MERPDLSAQVLSCISELFFKRFHTITGIAYARNNIKITVCILFKGDIMRDKGILKKTAVISAVVLFFFVLTVYPSACAEGAFMGLKNCAEILIPSLFPYMLLSLLIMYTGADNIIGKLFSPVIRLLFDLPSVCASAVILSMTGGYPVGASCITKLYTDRKITIGQAKRMMYFCVCPGPAFMMTAIGSIMLRNHTAGIILYASQVIPCIIIGIISGIISRIRKRDNVPEDRTEQQTSHMPLLSAFTKAAQDSSVTVISMTALVTVFTLFVNVLYRSGTEDMICRFLTGIGIGKRESGVLLPVLLEVTGGCKAVNEAALPLEWFALAAGLGGLCVHLQIYSIAGGAGLISVSYLPVRIINAVLSFGIVRIICIFYRPVSEVFRIAGGENARMTSSGAAGSIALLLLCIIFVLSFHGRVSFRYRSFGRNNCIRATPHKDRAADAPPCAE